jgi:hypothetical protein
MEIVTLANAEPKGIQPFLVRKPVTLVDPTGLASAQWRAIVAKAPVVRACITTLILQVVAIPWAITGDNQKECDGYKALLQRANGGEGFKSFLGRVIRDALEVPFGGAMEVTRDAKGVANSLWHVDGGTLAPTYERDTPYAQINPQRSYDIVRFAPDEIVRVPWLMRTDIANYGWTITPCMDSFPAIESLMRTDIFYQTLLSDTPPPGLLDLLDMTQAEALDWAKGFRETFEGIDRFKIPILYDHKTAAQWISFQETGLAGQLADIVHRYSEVVAASFGMSVVDLGLFQYSQTKAGSVAQLDTSKRQGLGALMEAIASAFNEHVLPDTANFEWQPLDTTDKVQKATAQKTRVDTIDVAVKGNYIDRAEARKMMAQEEIFDVDPNALPEEPTPLPAPAPAAVAVGPDGQPVQVPTAAAKQQPPQLKPGAPQVPSGKAPVATPKSLYEGIHLADHDDDVSSDVERAMVNRLTREFSQIAGALPESVLRRAIDLVWDAPEMQADPAADVLVAAIEQILSQADAQIGLSDEGQAMILALMSEAYRLGLMESADNAWAALKATGYVEGDLSLSFDVQDPAVIAYLTRYAGQMVKNIDDGTKSILARVIYTGVKQGKALYGSKDSVAAAIVEATAGAIGKKRAESIALFEVRKAQSDAHIKQYQTLGLTKKHWVAIPALACDICQANDGMGFVSMDSKFQSVFGECDGPPGHPTVCHCRLELDRSELLARAESGELFTFFDGTDEVDVPGGD